MQARCRLGFERRVDAAIYRSALEDHLAEAVGPSGEVVGVEISPEAAINAHRRIESSHWENVHLLVGNAKTIQLAGMFDGLVTFAAPDVYTSPEAIANLFAYLRPDARIVIFGAKLSHHRLGALPQFSLTEAHEVVIHNHSRIGRQSIVSDTEPNCRRSYAGVRAGLHVPSLGFRSVSWRRGQHPQLDFLTDRRLYNGIPK